MIQASNAFKQAVATNQPQRCLFEFSDTIFTNEDVSVSSGGVRYVDTFNDDKDLTMGRCPSARIEFTLFNELNLLKDFEFGEFRASIGALIGREPFEQKHSVHVAWKDGFEFTVRNDGLYLNGTKCSVQPNAIPETIVIDGNEITTYSKSGGFWRASIDQTGHLNVRTAPPTNPFMAEKMRRWTGRGICRNGTIVTEWLNGRKNTWEYVPLGVFDADRPNVAVQKTIDVIANDIMRRLDDELPTITYPITHKELLTLICNTASVEIGTQSFINDAQTIQSQPSDFKGATMKDVVGWIAEAACSVARIGRDGKLRLKWFEQTDKTIGESESIKYEPFWYQTQQIDRLVVRNYDADNDTELGSGTNGYIIENNPLMKPDKKARSASDSQAIYDRLNAVPRYTPATLDAFSDWTTEAGDVVTVTNNGETRTIPVFKMSMEWAGAPVVKLESTGNKRREKIRTREQRQSYSISSALNKQAEETQEQLDEFYETEYTKTDRLIRMAARAITGKDTDDEAVLREALVQVDDQGFLAKFADGDVVSAINLTKGTAKIKADLIELDGYAIASALAVVDNLEMGGNLFVEGSANLGETGVSFLHSASDVVATTFDATEISLLSHYHTISATDSGTVSIGKPTDEASSANFNIADTNFYKAGVSAAYERGKAEGGGVVPGDISLGSFEWIDSQSSRDVSSYTTLSTMGSLIRTHKDGQGYILFAATVKGAVKHYKVPIG